jgi:hypothetical protein
VISPYNYHSQHSPVQPSPLQSTDGTSFRRHIEAFIIGRWTPKSKPICFRTLVSLLVPTRKHYNIVLHKNLDPVSSFRLIFFTPELNIALCKMNSNVHCTIQKAKSPHERRGFHFKRRYLYTDREQNRKLWTINMPYDTISILSSLYPYHQSALRVRKVQMLY